MMVKNEEAFLDDALASAKAWADEIVVVIRARRIKP